MKTKAGRVRGTDPVFEALRRGNLGARRPAFSIVRPLQPTIQPRPVPVLTQPVAPIPVPVQPVTPIQPLPPLPVPPPCPRISIVRAVESPDCPKCGSWKTVEFYSPLDVLGHDSLGTRCLRCHYRWNEDD